MGLMTWIITQWLQVIKTNQKQQGQDGIGGGDKRKIK